MIAAQQSCSDEINERQQQWQRFVAVPDARSFHRPSLGHDSAYCFEHGLEGVPRSHLSWAKGALGLEIQSVELCTGAKLNYAIGGPEDGPCLIFLHGWAESWRAWQRVVSLLAKGKPGQKTLPARCVLLDLRGFGDSEYKTWSQHRLGDHVDDVLALMDTLNISRATFIGFSLGSGIAQAIALAAPARVRSLVLLGSTLFPGNLAMSELLNELRSRTDSKAVHGTLPFLEDYLGTMLEDATHIPQWVHDIMLHEALKPSRACLIESLHGLLMEGCTEADLSAISAPVRLVRGQSDMVVSDAEHQTLLRLLPYATSTTIPAAGHAVHIEEPEAVTELLVNEVLWAYRESSRTAAAPKSQNFDCSFALANLDYRCQLAT